MAAARVVVGLFEGPAAPHTLAWAMREATTTGAQLVVVRAGVARLDVLGAVARGSMQSLELVDPALARAVRAARMRLGDDRVAIVVDRDRPGEVLVRVARPGDLLVVGAPTRSGWWARASTTYHVCTRADCPVVVVHEPASGTAPAGIGDFFRSHVVVGVDGSPAARAALEFGFSYAADRDLPVVAVTVNHRADNDVWFDDTMLETHLASEPEAAAALAHEVEPWHLKYPAVPVKRALVGGDPVEGLRRVARHAAILAVGTAGTGLAQLGTVSRGLAEKASCPVAVVRLMP